MVPEFKLIGVNGEVTTLTEAVPVLQPVASLTVTV